MLFVSFLELEQNKRCHCNLLLLIAPSHNRPIIHTPSLIPAQNASISLSHIPTSVAQQHHDEHKHHRTEQDAGTPHHNDRSVRHRRVLFTDIEYVSHSKGTRTPLTHSVSTFRNLQRRCGGPADAHDSFH